MYLRSSSIALPQRISRERLRTKSEERIVMTTTITTMMATTKEKGK
jgi:hypothetical protein